MAATQSSRNLSNRCRTARATRGRGLFSLYIYIENFKNLLVRNHWTDFKIILQKCSFGDPLPRLFKPFGFIKKHGRHSVFTKSFQQMQDSCQTDWNFWQDKIKFCRTGGLSVIKLLSLFARNHRTFVRQTEIFCRTEWKFASFVRQSWVFAKIGQGAGVIFPIYLYRNL